MAENQQQYVNKDEEEINIFSLFIICFHNCKRLLIIFASVTLVGFLGIKFIFNPLKANYVIDFTYDIPSLVDGKYLDGSNFDSSKIISSNNIIEVINSDEEFTNLNEEKIVSNITIESNTDTSTLFKDSRTYYTITVQQKLFDNQKQAVNFTHDLVNYAVNYTINSQEKKNYTLNLDNFNKAKTYDDALNALDLQCTYLTSDYENLTLWYGNPTLDNGMSVNDLVTELNNFINSDLYKSVIGEQSTYSYVKDPTYEKAVLTAQKSNLENEIKYNNLEIEQIENQIKAIATTSATSYDLDSYNTRIVELIGDNAKLQKSLDPVNAKLEKIENGETTPVEFIARLNEVYDELKQLTEECDKAESELTRTYSNVIYYNNLGIKSDGGLSTVLSLVIPAAVGLIAGACVNVFIDRNKLSLDDPYADEKKNKTK